MAVIKFQINNWDKFNPRSDRKNFSWFRFQHNFFSNAKVFELCTDAKMSLIYIYCEASRKCDTGRGVINTTMAAVQIGITEKCLRKQLQVLEKFEFVLIDTQKNLEGILGCPTNERTDETNVTNERDVTNTMVAIAPCDKDFDELLAFWNSKKIVAHKKTVRLVDKILPRLHKKLKHNSMAEILQAIENYAEALSGGFFTYRWTLLDFMTRDSAEEKFFPENYVASNWMRTDSGVKIVENFLLHNPYCTVQDEKRHKLFEALAKMSILWTRKPELTTLKLLCEDFCGLENETLKTAILKARDCCKAFPTIAEFRTLLTGSDSARDEALEMSGAIIQAIGSYGLHGFKNMKEDLGEVACEAIASWGGWANLCRISDNQIPTVKAQLRDACKVGIKKQKELILEQPKNLLTKNQGEFLDDNTTQN